jgi:hypothetical protein
MTARPRLALFSTALALRVLILIVGLTGFSGAVVHYLDLGDGLSYVAAARTIMTGARDANSWHERAFLGWPLTFALPGAIVGYAATALALAAAFAALVPVVFWNLTRHRAASLALTALTPTWLLHSSLGMSEPAFLLYQLSAIWALCTDHLVLSSMLASAAIAVRPNGVFVWIALAFVMWRRRSWSALAAHTTIAAAGLAIVYALNVHLFGDGLRQVHLYSGLPNVSPQAAAAIARLPLSAGHLGLPFVHLLVTPFIVSVPLWKVVFIWAHAVAVVLICAHGARRLAAERGNHLFVMMLIWAVLNTAFVLCTGPYWGFYAFDRYCIWALPAYLYIVRDELPAADLVWTTAAAISVAMVIWGMARAFP